jgi:D-alanyl-D-alanine carboxypeptidase (penicillin-binding protein 5/6)
MLIRKFFWIQANIILFFFSFAFAKEIKAPYLTAASAVIVRLGDGTILYEKNSLLRLPPASTTKVMTVLIALEAFDMGKEVLIRSRAAEVEPTKAGLSEGTRYAMRDLIKACLMTSANDAAVSIAEEIAGSEENFAELMNKKARELGMKDTLFVNATGLPDNKDPYTTAYDLTILMREAVKDSLFVKIANLKATTIKGSNGREICLYNHNKMLWRKKGVIGKTGYTLNAKHCFVGIDTSQDSQVAFAILASRKPWDDISRLLEHSRHLQK